MILAWLVTILEIVSGGLLVFGRWVRYSVVFHALVIIGGIFLVHLQHGWFVVGHGANGIEYSVLILVVLLSLFHTHKE